MKTTGMILEQNRSVKILGKHDNLRKILVSLESWGRVIEGWWKLNLTISFLIPIMSLKVAY